MEAEAPESLGLGHVWGTCISQEALKSVWHFFKSGFALLYYYSLSLSPNGRVKGVAHWAAMAVGAAQVPIWIMLQLPGQDSQSSQQHTPVAA